MHRIDLQKNKTHFKNEYIVLTIGILEPSCKQEYIKIKNNKRMKEGE